MARLSDSESLALQEIIETLASTHGVSIDWRGGRDCRGRAYRKEKVIVIRMIRSMEHYAIALHELGHVIGAQKGARLEKEYQAWTWALEHSPIAFDEFAWIRLHASLRSYVKWARDRQFRERGRPVIPPNTHPLWSLLAKAKENF